MCKEQTSQENHRIMRNNESCAFQSLSVGMVCKYQQHFSKRMVQILMKTDLHVSLMDHAFDILL